MCRGVVNLLYLSRDAAGVTHALLVPLIVCVGPSVPDTHLHPKPEQPVFFFFFNFAVLPIVSTTLSADI